MAKVLYINPDEKTQKRATQLGCGWMPSVPAQYASVARAPCVIIDGAGSTVVLAEPTTKKAVAAALRPILEAEVTAREAVNRQQLSREADARQALGANASYLALATPTAAQTTTQVKALTHQTNALIRLLLQELQDVSGT